MARAVGWIDGPGAISVLALRALRWLVWMLILALVVLATFTWAGLAFLIKRVIGRNR